MDKMIAEMDRTSLHLVLHLSVVQDNFSVTMHTVFSPCIFAIKTMTVEMDLTNKIAMIIHAMENNSSVLEMKLKVDFVSPKIKSVMEVLIVLEVKTKLVVLQGNVQLIISVAKMIIAFLTFGSAMGTTTAEITPTRWTLVLTVHAPMTNSSVQEVDAFLLIGNVTVILIAKMPRMNLRTAKMTRLKSAKNLTSNVPIIVAYLADGDVIMTTIVATIRMNSNASIPIATVRNPNVHVPTECVFTSPNFATDKMIAKTTLTNYFAMHNAVTKNSNAIHRNIAFTNVGNATVIVTVPMGLTKPIAHSIVASPENSHVKLVNASILNGFVMVKVIVRMARTRTLICVMARPVSLTDTDAITTPNVFYGLLSAIPSKIVPIIPTNRTKPVRVPHDYVLIPIVFNAVMENVSTLLWSVMAKMIVVTTRMSLNAIQTIILVILVPVPKSAM